MKKYLFITGCSRSGTSVLADLLFKKFPNVKIVYIIRNIIEVAHSFELRALKTMFDHGVHNVPDNVWPISRNWESAVSGRNHSIEQTRQFSSKLNIHILPYEYHL